MSQPPEIVDAHAAIGIAGVDSSCPLPELFTRVASTVEHDFNDTLMVITSYCELLLDRTPPDDPCHNYIERIRSAARRAVKIGNMLFVFSRPLVVRAELVDLDAVLADLSPTVKTIAGRRRQVKHSAGPGSKAVLLAPGCMTHVVAATVAAVCDGVTSADTIDIKTGMLRWDGTSTNQRVVLASGEYVWMSVGAWSSQADLRKNTHDQHVDLADFYRTLANVREQMKACGGELSVHCDSSVDVEITVYLPRIDCCAAPR